MTTAPTAPPSVPPIAPDQVFLGLNLGQSFFPPIKLPVKYGKNITNMYLVNKKDSSDIDPDACAGQSYFEISGGCLPIHKNGKLYCECKYENPCPDKKILSIEYVPCESKKEFAVELLDYKA